MVAVDLNKYHFQTGLRRQMVQVLIASKWPLLSTEENPNL